MNYQVFSGNFQAVGLQFGLVVSRWHELVNGKLLDGAIDAILRHGGSLQNIEVAYVPGSYEIPFACQKMAQRNKYQAIIALGTIIRGQTLHFDLIAAEAVKGIAQISLQTNIPVSLGILTTDTLEQALERAGSKQGNKGFEAAMAAMEMANLFQALEK